MSLGNLDRLLHESNCFKFPPVEVQSNYPGINRDFLENGACQVNEFSIIFEDALRNGQLAFCYFSTIINKAKIDCQAWSNPTGSGDYGGVGDLKRGKYD